MGAVSEKVVLKRQRFPEAPTCSAEFTIRHNTVRPGWIFLVFDVPGDGWRRCVTMHSHRDASVTGQAHFRAESNETVGQNLTTQNVARRNRASIPTNIQTCSQPPCGKSRRIEIPFHHNALQMEFLSTWSLKKHLRRKISATLTKICTTSRSAQAFVRSFSIFCRECLTC